MRIVFMGTPDFAVPSLKMLLHEGYEVCGAYTQPDKPKGRGHQLQAPPVKELALENGIPVFQPASLRTPEALEELSRLAPDLIVVVAYGKILPKTILDLPQYGCINVHGSLLPKYRGAAPIQWTVLNGDPVAGVTTMYMGEGMDTGDMLLKAETPVGPEETAGQLFDRLMEIGAELLRETLEKLIRGELKRILQREEDATLAPMLRKEQGRLEWTKSAGELYNQIRGLNPWPSAYTVLDGKKVKIHSARVIAALGKKPGELCQIPEGLAVDCGEGALLLTEIQPENSRRMDGKSYLLGHPLKENAKFENE